MRPYGTSLALATDLYELTMAQGYWKLGRAEREAVFHLFFRTPPFRGGYATCAGAAPVADYLESLRFDESDIAYLASLMGNDGQPLFRAGFLRYLSELELACDIDVMPEGTLAFGHEPLLRVRGPILQCQLLETPLLNIINFQTLVATKAARVCAAARGEPVLEFGLRRAQGFDGGLSASRAAYVGGCAATSNVLAGKAFGIPVRGTHAHSWVMSFDNELEAFEAYAEVMPNNCVFLVDTYDTLDGVRHAIEVGKRLQKRGYEMAGVRLDSGDLTHLSIEARRMLDAAGFAKAAIVGSNDLDEYVIESLKQQGATISIWGVGTRLATAYDQPALGGVYKLSAVKDDAGRWVPKLKRSEQAIKTSIPGMLQVRRYRQRSQPQQYVHDMIFDELTGIDDRELAVEIAEPHKARKLDPAHDACDLLQPLFRNGKRVGHRESLAEIRARCIEQLSTLSLRTRRFMNPQPYPVGLDVGLHERRLSMMTTQSTEHAIIDPGRYPE